MAVFAASGLLHEAVISVPAGGGYGLPTAYFLLQGGAVLLERSSGGRRAGLGAGLRGRAFTAVLVAGPLFWLFHPPFVREVVLPMLRALGTG
jgi:alginate O-acetyltransferase complex protein AlgI